MFYASIYMVSKICLDLHNFGDDHLMLRKQIIGIVSEFTFSPFSVANIALGVHLFFDSSGYTAVFGLFLLVAVLGVVMFAMLHLLYNVLPRIPKCHGNKGGK